MGGGVVGGVRSGGGGGLRLGVEMSSGVHL